VIILPGAGTVGLDYLNVLQNVAEFTTAVLYDRAGTGWSDPVEMPRTSTQATDELQALLSVMRLGPPYVLVGHSLGGLYARHFAARFPNEVCGLVLLDPAHEDYNAYAPPELLERSGSWDPSDLIPQELPAEFIDFYRGLFSAEVAGWPDEITAPLIEAHLTRRWLMTGAVEATNVEDLYREVAGAGPLPDVPVVILCSVGVDNFKRAVSVGQSEKLLAAECDGRRRLYDDLAARLPRAESRAVPEVGHVTLHFRRPDVVVEAVRDVIGAAKTSGLIMSGIADSRPPN
jgi:pimeloyl-ACP methyl ester carboxylesterase